MAEKRVMYVLELTEAEEGGLELVDPSWCKLIIAYLTVSVAEQEDMETTETATEFAMSSDARSEFSEYSTMSRKSSFFAGSTSAGQVVGDGRAILFDYHRPAAHELVDRKNVVQEVALRRPLTGLLHLLLSRFQNCALS